MTGRGRGSSKRQRWSAEVPSAVRHRRSKIRGQALVELSLALPLMLLLVCSVVDYGRYWAARIDTAQSVRDGVRYASIYPTRWSPVAVPAPNTIESSLLVELTGPATWTNDDSHFYINYYDTSTAPYTYCGTYSVTSAAFVAASGYTQATCVKDGNEVLIELKSSYEPLTPLASAFFSAIPIPVDEQASMIIEGE
jgi:hypothetical protein